MRLPRCLVVLAVLAAAACSSADGFAPLPDPGPTSSTTPSPGDETPDFSDVPLEQVPGTTTSTVALGPGDGTMVGRVDGPDGAVAGATVRVERLVGDAVAVVDVPTAADGTWNVTNILGGRYRVRAWRQPDLAMTTPEIFFFETERVKNVVLRLSRFEGLSVASAVAPSPPPVDELVNLRVRVVTRTVDQDGIVRATPVVGAEVALTGSGDWQVDSSNPGVTDGGGSVVFRLVCRRTGPQPLNAVVDLGEGGESREVFALSDIPACEAPPPSTTSTTADPSGTTSSTTSTTSRSGSTSTTTSTSSTSTSTTSTTSA